MQAHVQRDAVSELPAAVRPVTHPVSAGARRAVTGLLLRHPEGLLHGLDVDLPLRSAGPTVTTVHDLSVFDVPWAHPVARARGERLLVRQSIRRADAVIAVSRFTAERVGELFGRECTVTSLAPAPVMQPPGPTAVEQVRKRFDVPLRCVVSVGTIEPRKNVAMLARACARVEVPLLLAGKLAHGESVPWNARHLGYVPVADLPALYAAASAVAYPSSYEGFGLPPVEAMACGAAVVASAVGGLPDVVGEGAVLVRPDDEDDLAAALARVVENGDRNLQLRTAAVAAAGRLSWSRTAHLTLDVYRRLGVRC